jgi:small conductance mechanosensitive channel
MSTLLQTIIPVDSLVVNAPLTFGELVKEGNINQILDNALTWSIEFIIYIFVAILIFIIGRFIISKIVGFFKSK